MYNYNDQYYYGNNNAPQQEEKIDVLAIVNKLMAKWYYFAICVPIFLAVGVYVVKTSPSIFAVSATMLVNTENTTPNIGANQYMPSGIQLYTSQDNIVNEIGRIRSVEMMKKVLDSLDFDVSYFEEGSFLAKEKYKDPKFPFKVNVDFSHLQLINTAMYVTPDEEKKDYYRLKIEADGYKLTDEKEGIIIDRKDIEFKIDTSLAFGQPVSHPNFKFTIDLTEQLFEEDVEYMFMVHSNKQLAEGYKEKIGIEKQPESSILILSTEGATPAKDIIFLNSLCDTYINSKLDEKNSYAQSTIDFIEDQISNVRSELDSVEQQLGQKGSAIGTDNIDDLVKEARIKKSELDREIRLLSAQINDYTRVKTEVESATDYSQIVTPAASASSNPTIYELATQIRDLATQRKAELETKSASSTEIKKLDSRIASLRITLIKQLESHIGGLTVQLEVSRAELGRASAILRSAPQDKLDIGKILIRKELKDNLFDYLMHKLAEAKIAKKANRPDSRILDEARLRDNKPKSPKKMVILATSMILGLVFPAVFILIGDIFDNKVKSEEQIVNHGKLTVLANIIHQEQKTTLFDPEFLISPMAEAFRYLKVNLENLMPADGGRKVIGITSMVQGEGKTFTSTHLAAILALSGKRTVIIGADIRRPQLFKRLEVDNTIGLTNYLLTHTPIEDIIQESRIKNLDIIPSGMLPPNPSESLQSPKLVELVQELRNRYDIVIVDTPPMGLVSDFLVISKVTDLNLLVIRNNYSKLEFVKEAAKMVEEGSVGKLFAVFNDVDYGSGRIGGYASSKYGKKYSYGYSKSNDESSGGRKLWNKGK
ncbi:polysaccharide biosynthesis tyrosine autokinase [Pontibacter sp. G13]|uniref:exopolysaccharide transport family protein n=1 Tax=Pontibacter sp. G13 TaxID=3074898 RepID=UPI00288BE884|nr:polysaccharide biosynthesis tyrosine autokinase [Pontibacter sp. G13]WNJ19768.1 polysaccharide biosynthesis tyrosine autokinase [Pontibacter sp. G13]